MKGLMKPEITIHFLKSEQHNMDDKSNIGDLSRFSSDEGAGYNLPLSGVNSIRGRSLVVVDDQSNVVSCTTIDWDMAGWTELAAKATFTGQVTGTITLYQSP
ncbi:hypothetical protein EGW08_000671 [Elysia chlorotica]|uniref:Uncharacterized protein n=1 Tax=Elysia chlorotica TaxID=188477 RepID=A0A433UCL9_ELYCH|nr:hypothetical protein EGW08_000671 [Elysia chlorotica]